ncbi:YHS domain-containing protein [Chitinophaga ginsengisegetis]|uniref:YHS domain-containing protein n=1 Tax=Chitinophaga ginsengisegetis TaxID=393003 RepID=UPI000DB99544|nr:YHS domain-containing protein [Chitinophaga ginsengisegetis]MDR6565692.1 YHS domain-containing protein [Chitinophaga ginsengisegetis]MDR6645421.1 YHS domain-containing protein [Chitinophaga ginsengisegetis]MDR6651987.1 YHS domain-containing protein [Chitinophaga ginsengisegetis]
MKYIFITCSTLFLFACAQKQAPAENAGTPAPAAAETPAVVASNKLPDPVCEMPYDTSYKEWAVYKTDTLHFCSTTCKGVFEKAPEKYMAKLGK